MRVIPLAADSLGVRSMATYVEAGALRLLIDPGAALAPLRFGLGPTPDEEEALTRAVAHRILAAHRELAQLIEKRDGAGARQLMDEHVKMIRSRRVAEEKRHGNGGGCC